MLDYAFAQYEVEIMLDKDSVIKTIEVEKGRNKFVDLVPLNEVSFLNKKGTNKKNATYEISIDKVKAPVKEGDIVGNLKIKEDENVIREVPITVRESVEKSNLFELYFRHLTDIFKGDVSL